jgi:hypothetical protein
VLPLKNEVYNCRPLAIPRYVNEELKFRRKANWDTWDSKNGPEVVNMRVGWKLVWPRGVKMHTF